jgi:hypothetical protein
MNVQLNHILAQEHIADLHRAAALERRARDADPRSRQARSTPIQPAERLTRPSAPAISHTRP